MQIDFYKYQGTGNDFILIDNRDKTIDLSTQQIMHLCDRHFGVGADGLMLLEQEKDTDFRMIYFNADGNESTMCGNGGRCITAFAKQLGIINNRTLFTAIDGLHEAEIHGDGIVSLQMKDVSSISIFPDHTILDTGSPHYIQWVEDVQSIDVYQEGKRIRSQDVYQPKGINVNFVQRAENNLIVRTYERGVEAETLSCGTGVTAAAIATVSSSTGDFITPVNTPGGNLTVRFTKATAHTASNIWLSGPAQLVFKGIMKI